METDMLTGVVRLMDMRSRLDPSPTGHEAEELIYVTHLLTGTLGASAEPCTRIPMS